MSAVASAVSQYSTAAQAAPLPRMTVCAVPLLKAKNAVRKSFLRTP